MSKTPVPIYSLSEAARRLNVDRVKVGLIVKLRRIPTFAMPLNGYAKGLTRAGFRELERVVKEFDLSAAG